MDTTPRSAVSILQCCIIVARLIDTSQAGRIIQQCVYPSVSDLLEVKKLTYHIKNDTFRFIMENHLMHCPGLHTCSSEYNRQYVPQYEPICEQCSCDNTCIQQGSCCPSVLISESSNSSRIGIRSCEIPQITQRVMFKSVKQSYFMVTKCNSNECERFSMTASAFAAPVTSITTHKTYINEKCAMCNDETENSTLSWESELRCVTSPGSLSFENIKKAILQNHLCNIIYTPPRGAVTDSCPWGLITKCNVTGHWSHYDARIEFGCSAYTAIYLEIYRNVFCYMCNVEERPYMECEFVATYNERFPASFSVLLDFRTTRTEHNKQAVLKTSPCSQDEKYDPYTNDCRQITCSANLLYDSSTFTCQQPFTSIRAMRYRLYVKVVPSIELKKNCSNCQINICSLIKDQNLYQFIFRNNLNDKLCSVRIFYKKYKTTSDKDDCSTENVRYFTLLLEHGITFDHNYLMQVSDLLSVGDAHEQFLTSEYKITFKIIVMGINRIPRRLENNIWLDSEDSGLLYEFHSEEDYDTDVKIFCRKAPLTLVSYTTLCPRILLNASEVMLETDNSTLVLPSLNVTFVSGEYENIGENIYLVCSEKYFRKVENYTSIQRKEIHIVNVTLREQIDIDAIEGIFSLVCTVLSVLSLLITIITYSVFGKLRTIPGKNTLGLCITLLFAHLSYPYAHLLSVDKVACVVAGISTHYFWLCSIFWMNVCCIHMFRVFRSVEELVASIGTSRTFLTYCGYVTIGPTVFIAINIGVSLHFTDASGYGGPRCYITSPVMVLYTFALPIAVVILSNLVMFFIVVCKLQNTANVDMANKSARNNFKIYIKLSSLTGMTWILGFLYQWLLFKPISFAFILLTAGQGVFIMISFVCNSRIKTLYAERIASKSLSTS